MGGFEVASGINRPVIQVGLAFGGDGQGLVVAHSVIAVIAVFGFGYAGAVGVVFCAQG